VAIITWNGSHAGVQSFNDRLNWVGGVAPIDDDAVVIAAVANEPITDAPTANLASLTVNTGAELTVGNFIFVAQSTINDGTITGVFAGANPANNGVTFQFAGAASTLTNSGTVTGESGGDGVQMRSSGTVTNSASGTITGGTAGILGASAVPGTVINAGTITGTADAGVLLNLGGTITNNASGIIAGGTDGIRSAGASAAVTNAGTIRGTGPKSIGVLFSDSPGNIFDNTLSNSGTIIGTSAAAVQFGAGDDTLDLLPGASFTGVVDGGGGANTLELSAGSGGDRLTGIGTQFINFGTLLLDSGAVWTLAGSGTDGLSTTEITGFASFDTIDLTGLAFNAVSGTFAGDTLALTNAAGAQDTLHLQGKFSSDGFSFSSDGTGGTNIVLATPPGSVRPHGSHDQYVIVNDNGTLVVDDTVSGRDGNQELSGVDDVLFSDGTGVFDPTGTAGIVLRLYQAALGRTPDLAGLKFWTSDVDTSHASIGSVADTFASSPEFIHNFGSPLPDAAFIQALYQNVLGRAGDSSGVQFWQSVLTSGVSRGGVTLDFAESPENRSKTVGVAGDKNDAESVRLYQAALNRAPDQSGEAFWSTQLANGATPSQVAQSFISSSEFFHTFGTLDSGDFVSALYTNVLHRPADAAGLKFWTDSLQQGSSQANVLVSFSDSLENRMQTAAATHDGCVFFHA
jgi:hypothetical protein